MNVLLIDADSTIPNIPLMKLCTWHKKQNDSVSLIRLNLPYYPTRPKKRFDVPTWYDLAYCSVIFEGNQQYIHGENIVFGGTGVDLKTVLPDEVECCECDYSIYPENNISYGFITRGCIRRCGFCKVPEKEGGIHRVSDIDRIVRHQKTKFLDNNILSYPKHNEVLSELVEKQICCQFNQGLDIRLLTKENSVLLSRMNYFGEYVFAFDSWKINGLIEERLELLDWRKDWQVRFFVYVHPEMPINETVKRLLFLRKHKCIPYLMRDIACWPSKHHAFYTDLAAYCNQVAFFKKMEFDAFLHKRCSNLTRVREHSALFENEKD